MKKFLKNISSFLLILLLLNLILLNFSKKLYFEDYDDYSLDFNTYLMADSHGERLKEDTNKFNVYNFSAGSESYFDMKRKLNFLIEKSSIDTLIISVDGHALSPYREKFNNLDKSRIYATYNDYDSKINYYRELIKSRIVFLQPKMALLIREYSYEKLKSGFFTQRTKKFNPANDYWSDLEISKKIKKAKNRAQMQFKYESYSLRLKKTLIEIIKICHENNITLIGIKFPITETYYDIIATDDMGADIIFKEKGIKVLDFSTLFLNDDSMFSDQDHLNRKGARVFTKILMDSLQRTEY